LNIPQIRTVNEELEGLLGSNMNQKHNRSLKVPVQGQYLMAHSSHIQHESMYFQVKRIVVHRLLEEYINNDMLSICCNVVVLTTQDAPLILVNAIVR
jgi:hypothetical protein